MVASSTSADCPADLVVSEERPRREARGVDIVAERQPRRDRRGQVDAGVVAVVRVETLVRAPRGQLHLRPVIAAEAAHAAARTPGPPVRADASRGRYRRRLRQTGRVPPGTGQEGVVAGYRLVGQAGAGVGCDSLEGGLGKVLVEAGPAVGGVAGADRPGRPLS